MRVGVFICHCGNNIAGTVDVARVAEETRKIPGVVYATDYMYTCSEPGQDEIKQAIKREGLNRVVVAACSPRMHELTFRRTVEKAGLNRYFFEMANIREHISWVGEDKEANTKKAIEAVRMAVTKVMQDKALCLLVVQGEQKGPRHRRRAWRACRRPSTARTAGWRRSSWRKARAWAA